MIRNIFKNHQRLKISQQHLQTVKLLEISEEGLPDIIEKELQENPALEQIAETKEPLSNDSGVSNYQDQNRTKKQEIYQTIEEQEPIQLNLYDKLLQQVDISDITDEKKTIVRFIITNLSTNGYLERDIRLLISDILYTKYLKVTDEEINDAVDWIKNLDPIGCGCRSLKEFLLLQITKIATNYEYNIDVAKKIIEECFDLLIKNDLKKIYSKLSNVAIPEIKEAFAFIAKLKTRPYVESQTITPIKNQFADFIVEIDDNRPIVSLFNNKKPLLKVAKTFQNILDNKDNLSDEESINFAKSGIERAKMFIAAIEQRKKILLQIMKSIADKQFFFL